jgi:hypothetical protein
MRVSESTQGACRSRGSTGGTLRSMPAKEPIRSAAVDEAADHLYGVPLSTFVAERKRLVGELRSKGDRASATAVGALGRPSVSAWVVNQLHRQASVDLQALFDAAARMKTGDLSATEAHRQAVARLRARAGEILVGDGHAASETTLRRVSTTLLALSVDGSFDPDPPGQLVADRDPPGFEAMVGMTAAAPSRPPLRLVRDEDDPVNANGDAEAARAEARRRERAERAEARSRAIARATTELAAVEKRAADARRQFETADREVTELRERLRRLEDQRDQASARAAEIDDEVVAARRRLTALREGDDESD